MGGIYYKKTFIFILYGCCHCLVLNVPALAAGNGTVLTLTASGTTSEIMVSGTTSRVTAAVIVQVQDGSGMPMQSFTVLNDAFSRTISGLSLTNGQTYIVRAADFDRGSWKDATVTVCNGHVYSGACDTTCNVCNAKRTVSVDHTYTDCEDTTCNVCSETRIAPGHNYNTAVWEKDETYHWHKCNGCDSLKDKAKHSYGDDNVCDICGYTKSVTPTESGNSEGTAYPSDDANSRAGDKSNDANPHTGNSSNMLLWLSVLIISRLAIIGTSVYLKKRKHSK